ncbi:MAG: hypothetical protein KKC79_18785 [Gammaproteobacteria bacterium]|nr:hypothetical protein [Gammaproteobacteria bacterium]
MFATRALLVWFGLSLVAAFASPLVNPRAIEYICSGAGAVKAVVQTDDGAQELGKGHMDCPLCVAAGAPPPLPVFALPTFAPLSVALQPIPAAHIAAATAVPPPARAPPAFS